MSAAGQLRLPVDHHESLDEFAPFRIRHPDHGCILDAAKRQKRILDLAGDTLMLPVFMMSLSRPTT